jgi:hypothetical protein
MNRVTALISTLLVASALTAAAPARAEIRQNLVPNGSFEELSATGGAPDGWSPLVYADGASLTRDADISRDGLWSARIEAVTPNDAAWTQTIAVEPDRNYLLSGWIKTESVTQPEGQLLAPGATLCLMGTWLRTPALTGTNDWTFVRLVFNSGPTGTVTIGARLGYWAGVTSGTAWFDDIRVTEIVASDPHPRWKVLVLVYGGTDFTYTDQSGTHHVIGQTPPEQVTAAGAAATQFVNADIPALNSGNMIPELTVRYPGTLRHLSWLGDGWWPSPADTAPERDAAFDSVIVIWQPTVVDQDTGQRLWIGNAAGLTPPMGTDQAYTAIIMEAATQYGHRNVFKHEWGHSILFYFDAAGTAPRPTVQNHTEADTYVHCGTGAPYVWIDETDASPIANSIYSNASGFTHDYYSGETALATDPLLQCLGITAAAWATGGPVSKPGAPEETSPAGDIHAIRTALSELVKMGWLRVSWSRPLESFLNQAGRAAADGDPLRAVKMLNLFRRRVDSLETKHRLSATNANELRRSAEEAMAKLLADREHRR